MTQQPTEHAEFSDKQFQVLLRNTARAHREESPAAAELAEALHQARVAGCTWLVEVNARAAQEVIDIMRRHTAALEGKRGGKPDRMLQAVLGRNPLLVNLDVSLA